MSSRELSEWATFFSLEPFGDMRGDIQAAIVAATIANVNRKQGSKPLNPTVFMPKFEQDRGQSMAEQLAAVQQWHKRLGGQ